MKRISILAVPAVLLMMSSCINHGSSDALIGDDETTATSALSDPFTALGTGDETEGFGDSDVESVDSDEAPASDPYAPADEADSDQPTTPDCDVYSLLLRWGQLTGLNRDISGMTNWSGDLSANAGTLSVIKKVAFDSNDSVSERTDPKVISFTSHTRPHFDGLRVRYEVCDADKALLPLGDVPTLTFAAANVPFTAIYNESDLPNLNDLQENVDANGDRFQAMAVKKTDLCQGTLEGEWTQLDANYGVLKGIVVASNGIRVGYVKGFFGKKDGESKWVAKFISRLGHFGGIMKGTYADNTFSGDIYNSPKHEIGSVDGSFVLPAEMGTLGTFSANYTLDCADVPSDE